MDLKWQNCMETLFLTLRGIRWLELTSRINNNTIHIYGTPFAMWLHFRPILADSWMDINVYPYKLTICARHSISCQLCTFIIRMSLNGQHNSWGSKELIHFKLWVRWNLGWRNKESCDFPSVDIFKDVAVTCLIWDKKDRSFTEDRKLNFMDNQSRVPPIIYLSLDRGR